MSLLPIRLAVAVALAGATLAPLHSSAAPRQTGPDDAVVVAVIDYGFSPYHNDFRASHMPQARNKDRTDDLPLTRAPHSWLPGFPKTSSFASYRSLPLTLATDPEDTPNALKVEDADRWATVKQSKPDEIHYVWLPGTKVIGAVSFGSNSGERIVANTGAHGMGTTSVSVGNVYGACPECLLLFVDIQRASNAEAEQAIDWVMSQPWIDAVTNSYGFSAAERDRLYNGSSLDLQKAATDRGQAIFFSAGNGHGSAFTVPNQTLMSSQEGPDWIITVGATDPKFNRNYPGSGKPADIAGVGSAYPSSYQSTTQTNGNGFGGTSNATPTIAGTYSRALYLTRRLMPGRSRMQSKGVIARGKVTCQAKRRSCELADGALTGRELRFRLLQGATPSKGGFTDLNSTVELPGARDERYLSEGHGTYRVRKDGTAKWLAEFDARLWKPLIGAAPAPARPAGDADWFLVDSWCRQHIWGEWTGGYWKEGAKLPARDPANWPSRTAYHDSCQGLQQPPTR